MWVFSKDGFFSAVKAKDSKKIVVRARFNGDLEKLLAAIGKEEVKVVESGQSDYRFRVELPSDDWVRYLAMTAMQIDYTNFKASLADGERHDVYLKVWSILKKAQEAKKRG